MTKLSVNINKFATLRNARGGNNPDVLKAAIDAQRFGADGVTVHPRPDVLFSGAFAGNVCPPAEVLSFRCDQALR